MIEPKKGEKIVVWFSCGAASAVAAKLTLAKYGQTNEVVIVNNPIKEEDEDNKRFLRDVEKWLGVKIHSAINSKYKDCSIVEVFEDRRYMSGVAGAPCTQELKKKARYEWEIKNRPDWTVLGFTKEEEHRFKRFKEKERPASIWILENLSKDDCFAILKEAGIQLPQCYILGMPNANCKGCVKSNSPEYWNLIRKIYPEDFKDRAEQSRDIGAKLVRIHAKYLPWAEMVEINGNKIWRDELTHDPLTTVDKKGKLVHSVRIYLDELPQKVGRRSVKNLKFECGIFCATDNQ